MAIQKLNKTWCLSYFYHIEYWLSLIDQAYEIFQRLANVSPGGKKPLPTVRNFIAFSLQRKTFLKVAMSCG